MSSYDALATSYDALMTDSSYERRAKWLQRLFQKSAIPVHSVLDLGCGTGTIACLLAENGYQVTAIDGSEEMLTQAMRKAEPLEERTPLFLHMNMSKLCLFEPVDAVISTIDSLNYLTKERDIRETIQRVYSSLKSGGQFIFDVNTPYKFHHMNEQMYMDETEDSFCVWRTFFSERTQICTYQVDLFQKREDAAWERTFEEHKERAWSQEQLRDFLTEAGFQKIVVTGDLSMRPPKENEARWLIRAEKK